MRYLLEKLYNKLFYRPYLQNKFMSCGRNFRLGYHSEIKNPHFFTIGDNFYAGPYSYFVTNKNNKVNIGDFVMFGPKCNIIGGNHDYSFEGFMYNNKMIDSKQDQITIENGVWLGANTTLLSGAKICEGSIIGAMSLVDKYIPPFVIAVGIPVKVLKPRFKTICQLENTLINSKSKYSLIEVLDIHLTYGFIYK